ncbi:MAG: TetR/AcrR family transcriptional regulator [Streptomycetaceae bacterium]|nr:TetR/AcrR family transcriptional regulator [Streptomycetaceae bacterium]
MSPRKSTTEALGTRDRIIRRSTAIASVAGLEGLTIGRVAADLGMSKAGVLGHFGTKEALQLAALDGASTVFTRLVWQPAAHQPPGLARLHAICAAWIHYLEHERETFPGGCLFTTAAVEFDARDGRVHDAVARLFRRWTGLLAIEARTAVENGELPPDTDPRQIAFELLGLFMALNHAIQLFADPQAAERTRRALDRLLTR